MSLRCSCVLVDCVLSRGFRGTRAFVTIVMLVLLDLDRFRFLRTVRAPLLPRFHSLPLTF